MASNASQPPPNPRLGTPAGGVRPRLDPAAPPPGPPPGLAPPAHRSAVGRRWGVPALIAWVTLSAFAGALWFAYEQGVRKGLETGFPVVRADDGPVKIRPDDPGGLEVPHQDKRIYERMAGDEAPVEDEARLRPEPERPVAREALIASSTTGVGGGNAAGTAAETTVTPVAPPPPKAVDSASGSAPAAPVKAAKTPASGPPPAKAAPPPPSAPGKTAETKGKPARQAAVAPPPRAAVASRTGANRPPPRVQLGSYRSAADAERAWKRLSTQEKPILGTVGPFVARADLGDRGVFYRLQAGPFESVAAARAACARLKQRKLGCLVVRPAAR